MLGVLALAIVVLIPRDTRADSFALAALGDNIYAGRVVEFSGSGFTPDGRVSSWATAPDGSVLSGPATFADDAGNFTISFDIPAATEGGQWAMTAFDWQTQIPVFASFNVIGRPADTARRMGWSAPEEGPFGSTFAFAAVGFDPNETVSYWITAPDATIAAAYPASATANDQGRVDITWTTPASGLSGTWVLTIQGIDSDNARGIAFDIR